MAETILTVARDEEIRRVPLDPKGQILGRGKKCDIVLDNSQVSRRHARIFRDPFGRWLIEDMHSRNGIIVDGRKVDVCAMQPGREVVLRPFILAVLPSADRQIPQDPALAESSGEFTSGTTYAEVVRPAAEARANISRARLKRLNAIADRLAELTRPASLYRVLCRCVARAPGSAAMVLRLTQEDLPQILACHVSREDQAPPDDEAAPVPLSRRVVQAVRSDRRAILATGRPDADATLTIIDETKPRTVFCGPIGEQAETIDALYVDLPSDQAPGDTFDFLEAVARQAGFARKSLLLAEAQAQHEVLEQQLATARAIQTALTPGEPADLPGVDVAVHYEPAAWVGGDYYDIWPLPDGRLAFAVADVADKGLPAAMAMANLQAALRTGMTFSTDLAQVVAGVNTLVAHNLPEGMSVSLFLALLDPSTGELQYINAGHIQPLTIAPDAAISPLGTASDQPLSRPGRTFQTASQTLAPHTALVLVTDGITHSTSPQGTPFGRTRLAAALTAAHPASARQLVDAAVTAAATFRAPAAQHDDITVLALVTEG